MAGRKKGFTLAQHRKAGPRLWKIREYLTGLAVEISAAYPLRTKATRKAMQALRAVDELRSRLDDLIGDENPDKGDAVNDVYYCANRMRAKKGGHQ